MPRSVRLHGGLEDGLAKAFTKFISYQGGGGWVEVILSSGLAGYTPAD